MPRTSREKLAVVTGASRGLGLAIARELASRGYRLLITARNEKLLQRAAASIPGTEAVAADVRDPASVARLARAVGRRRVSVLINNAGIAGPSQTVDGLDFTTWREVIDTNLHGTFLVTQALLPRLGRGSVVLNNLSVAARTVFPGMAAYCASKSGLEAFSNVLREELRPRGIRVVSLFPGAVDTEIWQQFRPGVSHARMMRPETIARLVAEAVTAPPETCVEELVVRPSAGTL